MRRFTHPTNAFSKTFENHCYALALCFFHYNFCRQHKTLRTSPAQAAGVTDELLDMTHLCKLIDDANPAKKAGGPSPARDYRMIVWRPLAACALAFALGGCALFMPKDALTSDDFKHTAEQQGDFSLSFAHCKADADVIMDVPPEDGDEYRERINAMERALVQCMQQRGYPYRDKDELLLPWHD